MTETREQWIEREARKARERCGYDDWDSRNELTRDVWRNVVAPFYQEPLRVPVDVDGLADAIRRAEGHCWAWEDISETSKRGYLKCALAALTYLNIKPEYDPNDVAFRRALKKSQEIVNNWTPEQRNHNSIGYVGLQDNERAELENLRAECKRLRDEVVDLLVEISKTNSKAERQRQALDANRKTIESRGAEIARLENEVKRLRTQQPETRLVKVRFDVTAEAFNRHFSEQDRGLFDPEVIPIICDYLAAHAVIDVPPGVPSVEELAEITESALDAACIVQLEPEPDVESIKSFCKIAAADIRDRILAGIQRREWTEEDVEELAREIHEAECAAQGDPDIAAARAALGWFDGKRGVR